MISYGGGSYSPTIALKSDGNPCVAWDSDQNIYLRCWDGQEWQELGDSASGGGISNDAGRSLFPTIAIDPNNTIYVAWTNQELNNDRIYIRAWNGTEWEELGTGSATGTGISDINGASGADLVIASDSTLYVVWGARYSGNIYGKQWTDSSWQDIGSGSSSGLGISNMVGSSSWPAIDIDRNDMLYVTWEHKLNTEHGIFVKMFDGNQWHMIGESSISGTVYSKTIGSFAIPDIAVANDGVPYVVWDYDYKVHVHYWDGKDWFSMDYPANGGRISALLSNRYAGSPKIAIDSHSQPYITWESAIKGNSYDIYIRYWNGRSWMEVGRNSASKGGVSNNDGTKPGGHSWSSSIAIGSDDQIYLAWEDQRSGITELFVNQWAGESWVSVGNDGDAGRIER